eukprot:gene47458-biopygen28353
MLPTTFKPTRLPTTFAPTQLPTTPRPTFKPTEKTNSPTLSIIPPKTTVTLSAVTISTVTLTVHFDIPSVYDGYVYCAALAEGTTVSTSTAGYGSSIDDTKGTKLNVVTGCCKTISFTNSPGSVYGDVTNKYTASTPLSSYIFSYTLSAAPRTKVTVTPIFKNLDYSPYSGFTVVPANKTFTAGSSSLTGSFYVTASALSSGQFNAYLQTSGANAGNYSSSSSLFTLLASASPIPAPQLLASQFSDAGNFVYI